MLISHAVFRRLFRRHPAYVTFAVLTFAVGVGLTTASYAIVYTIQHPYSPLSDPDHLGRVDLLTPPPGQAAVSPVEEVQALGATKLFGSVVAMSPAIGRVRVGSTETSAVVAAVDAGFFDVLGMKPALGRFFSPGAAQYVLDGVVVSDELWRRLFDASKPLEGQSIVFNNHSYSVVGVTPAGLDLPWHPDVWYLSSVQRMMFAIPLVRVPRGTAWSTAEAEFKRVVEHPSITGHGLRMRLRRATGYGMAVQKYHVALLGASIAVLLITCANLTGLMAVRVVAEERDTAVRLALGASRSSIALRLIGEAAIIAVAGAALGSLIAVWLAAIGRSLAPMVTTSIVPVTTRVSAPVILICCVAATVSLVATSAVPALRASRGSPLMVLNESFGMTGRQPRVMKVVVAGQIGFATTLMIAAVLMIRAANAIANTEFGYDARRLWSVQLGLVPSRSGDTTGLGSAEQSLFGTFIRNAHLIPGILGVSRIDQELSEGGRISAESRVSTLGLPSYWNTSSDILTTMGVRVILGRDFVPADSFSGAAIVDIDVARKLWGAEPAIGKTLILGINSPTTRRVTVVGVIPRIMMSFDRDPDMQEAQTVFVVGGVSAPPGFMRQFVVRTVTEDPRYAAALAQVSAAGNAIVGPWTDSYRSFADSRQAIALMFVMFSVCGLLLSGSGLYAVLANDLALRKRELAVRVALGAQSDSIAFLLVREVSPMLFGGAAFGVYLAFASTKLLGAWLYSVSPYDATAFAVSVAAVSALVALATALPARSAMKADPSMILRAS